VGDPEKTDVERMKAEAAAKMTAEFAEDQKRRREVHAKTVVVDGVKATGLLRSSGRKARAIAEEEPKKAEAPKAKFDEALEKEIVIEPKKGKTIDERVEEIRAGAGAEKRPEEEPKDADDEDALKAEASPSTSDIATEETKRRRIIRWKKLNEINRKCAVIRSFGGKCVIMTVGRSRDGSRIAYDFQSREAFEQWKANDFIPSLEKEKKTDVVGPWWWRHPKRRQYDGVVFKPRAPSVVITPDGQRLFNTYLGWGVEPEPGDWSLLRRHIREVLASGDPRADDYIIRFHAWAYQHPDSRADVAMVLIGEKGTGKGTMGRWLQKIFGHHSFQASSLDHIVGRFNAHKENCILFIADEAYWGGHKSAVGELQRMITEPTLPIERKGFDIYEAPNYIHMVMLAEPGWVIPAGRYERRYAAFDVSEAHMDDTAYFKALHHQIDNGGAAAMLYDLQRMELGDWHPRQVYKTGALRHQQELSLPPLDEWTLGLLEDGELPGTQPGRLQQATPTSLLNDLHFKVPRAHDIGKNKLATYLKKDWECNKHGGDVGFYSFPPLAEMRSIWNKKFGERKWSSQVEWGIRREPTLGDLLNERL
jgi:Family of unknown function (DUF5906)